MNADPVGVVGAVEQYRHLIRLMTGQLSLHQLREIFGDLAAAVADPAQFLLQTFGHLLLFRITAFPEIQRAVCKVPGLAEHLPEFGDGLCERYFRSVQEQRFEPVVFHFGAAHRQYLFTHLRQQRYARQQQQGGADVESRVGVGDSARQIADILQNYFRA